MVGPGEEVLLVREPNNPYDRNAIQVKNISRHQVGHIPRTVASVLAPLLDQKLVTVEGVINDGNCMNFDIVEALFADIFISKWLSWLYHLDVCTYFRQL